MGSTKRLPYWTTEGPIRGTCDHKHRTERGAVQCLMHDRRGCTQQGGYSDRAVYRITDAERVLCEVGDA